jgi:hypothetical protein
MITIKKEHSRKRTDTRHAAFILLPALVLVAGCAGMSSMPAPPRVDTSIEIAERPSTIALPVSFDVTRIDSKINSAVPDRLIAVDENKTACLPKQYVEACPAPQEYESSTCPVPEVRIQVSPAIDCQLKGSVYRDQFRTTASEKNGEAALYFSVPVKTNVQIEGEGEIGSAINGTITASKDVSGYVLLDIDENWNAVATVDPDFEWRDEPRLEVLGFEIPLTDKVEPQVRASMSQIESELEDQIDGLALRDAVETLWERGFFVEQINDKPEVWIRFAPKEIGFGGFESAGDEFKARLFVTGMTKTVVGREPPSPEATPLPPLKRGVPPGEFRLYMPVFVDYDYTARLLEDLLRVGEKQFFEVPVAGRVGLTFRDAEVYPTTGGAIAVGLTVDVDYSRAGLVDGTGLVWVKAKMAIDNERQIAYPSSLDFGADTDNSMLNMIVGVARRTSVKDQIETALTYDFSDDLQRGVEMANLAINRPIGDGAKMSGKITDAGLDRIKATDNGIYMGLHTVGELQLKVSELQD